MGWGRILVAPLSIPRRPAPPGGGLAAAEMPVVMLTLRAGLDALLKRLYPTWAASATGVYRGVAFFLVPAPPA